ncbi:hypothetical protein EGT74_10420 [Chitinophaga lutea]|uniref:Uncharacterized protein n=2 Tax=Chitinophaga lutea TaxID=2488634 RepID=A0A3N4Q3V1_9BACT|nr:hypothetical protein EGT74_10420 [Chitinophaga lutea]
MNKQSLKSVYYGDQRTSFIEEAVRARRPGGDGDKTVVGKYQDMSNRTLSPKQVRNNEIMEEANNEAKRIMADEELRHAAQVRLNVTSNKLYTSLVREYFKAARDAGNKETTIP